MSWETFLGFSSCVVACRHLCHVELATPWPKPLRRASYYFHSTRGSVTCATARFPRLLQMAAAARAAPRRRKGELLCWASDYFLSGEKDDDL